MTRDEALSWFEKRVKVVTMPGARAAHEAAIRALRPVSREQVEKVWSGCDFCKKEMDDYPYIVAHSDYSSSDTCYEPSFCPICGKPLTDEAVEIRLKELEALHGEKESD